MDKEDVVYIQWYTTQTFKKKESKLPFATTWMDLEGITLSGIRGRRIVYAITYMWNLRK